MNLADLNMAQRRSRVCRRARIYTEAHANTDEEDSRVKDGGRGWRWWRETQRGAVKAMSPGPTWTQMSTA